ncbi:MAG: hypothetical protein ACP5GJ_04510, partial [Nanopusillaceae archaeon]
TGIYSPNGTALLSSVSSISSSYLYVSPTANNIYIDFDYYYSYDTILSSVADINLDNGNLYVFYNNSKTVATFQVYLSTYYPNDYAILIDTPDWTDVIINTSMYNISCGAFAGEPGWIDNNYFGTISTSVYPGNVSINFNVFYNYTTYDPVLSNAIACYPISYPNSNSYDYMIPGLNSNTLGNVVYSIIPVYYNSSDVLLFAPISTSSGNYYLLDFNVSNGTVGYTSFTGSCTADNYLITCSNNGETDIYVVSGQPLTPTPTQVSYTTIPETATQTSICYSQQFNYTNFTAYLLHIFNVTFNQTTLSGVDVYDIYPYTYNNNPYILAIVGTVYPQLVS